MAICPKCSEFYFDNSAALSRRDNKTLICPKCGTLEAAEDLQNYINSRKEKSINNE